MCVPNQSEEEDREKLGTIGERALMSELAFGMQAQNNLVNRQQVSGLSGMVLERLHTAKSAAP